ncbi:MAG: 50S ribosomal protein L18e, partial [Candidatus Micrarchaeota archaeon]
MVKRGSERDDIKDLLATLKKAARANSARVWRKCAEMLGKSSRRRVEINLGKINKFSKTGETVLIPGKVL